MMISAWYAVALAFPVLLLGELLVRRSRWLTEVFFPPAVAGGLLVALFILLGNLTGTFHAQIGTEVNTRWWTWLCTAEPAWVQIPAVNVNSPFILVFFACIGLNGSWALIKRCATPALIFLALAGALAVLQNLVGVGLARLLHLPAMAGLVFGSLSLTGGHITTLGFAPRLERAGLGDPVELGMASATFGVVISAVVGGVVAGVLIRRRALRPGKDVPPVPLDSPAEGLWRDARSLFVYGRPFLMHLLQSARVGILADLRKLAGGGMGLLAHVVLVLVCLKAGSWLNWFVQEKVNFPVYLGAILFGCLARNILELARVRWFREEINHALTSVALGIFLTVAMMSLNLSELSYAVAPMFVILAAQLVVMILFARFVTFRVMGRDYDAAVLASGHVGFALGETPNALANMKAIEEAFGSSPRAFLIISLVVNLLLKLVNGANISLFLHFLGR